MDLELHQLNLRYEPLRVRQPARERRLLASIAEAGQQMPIVVVRGEGDAADHVVIDGYKRVRCLRQLHRDTVDAVGWAMGEAEALIFHQHRFSRSLNRHGRIRIPAGVVTESGG